VQPALKPVRPARHRFRLRLALTVFPASKAPWALLAPARALASLARASVS